MDIFSAGIGLADVITALINDFNESIFCKVSYVRTVSADYDLIEVVTTVERRVVVSFVICVEYAEFGY